MATAQNSIQELVPGLEAASDREQYLKSIVNEYPYFAAAQLAYVKELASSNAPTTLAKQKAALTWHPMLLEQLILGVTSDTTIKEIAAEEIIENTDIIIPFESKEPILESSLEEQYLEHKEEALETSNFPEKTADADITPELETQEVTSGSVMDLASALETPTANEIEEDHVTVWDEREKLETSLATEMNITAADDGNSENVEYAQTQETLSSEIYTPLRLEETMIKPQSLQDIFAAHKSEEKPSEPSEVIKETAAVVDEPLIFEPLHTSDYFASQGIKLIEEQMPADKLGKQLKSFTEWLQTMKSVHPVKLDLKTSLNQEVTNLAEKSNEEEDIITESMAFAYIAQGKPQKAADIYEKLKLLYPHKSAYFAAELLKLQ